MTQTLSIGVFFCVFLNLSIVDASEVSPSKTSNNVAHTVLRKLLGRNLLLSTDQQSWTKQFQCEITLRDHDDDGTATSVSYVVQRSGAKAALMLLSNSRLPVAFLDGNRFLYQTPDDPRRFAGFGRTDFEFEFRGTGEINLQLGPPKQGGRIELDIGRLLKAASETPDTTWTYHDQTRTLVGQSETGTLIVRFPRDRWPGHFPIAAMTLRGARGYEYTIHNFQCNIPPYRNLSECRSRYPVNHDVARSGKMPECLRDPLEFTRKYDKEPFRTTSNSLLDCFEYNQVLDTLHKSKSTDTIRQFCTRVERKEFDKIAADDFWNLFGRSGALRLAGSGYFYDSYIKRGWMISGYDRHRAAYAVELCLRPLLTRRLTMALLQLCKSSDSVGTQCMAIYTLSMLGTMDGDPAIERLGLELRFADTERVRHAYLALRILTGHEVKEREIDQLRAGCQGNPVKYPDLAFYLEALCLLDRVDGLNHEILEILEADPAQPTEPSAMICCKQLTYAIACSRAGRRCAFNVIRRHAGSDVDNTLLMQLVDSSIDSDPIWPDIRAYAQGAALDTTRSLYYRNRAAFLVARKPLDEDFRRKYVDSILNPPEAEIGKTTGLLQLAPHYLNPDSDPAEYLPHLNRLFDHGNGELNHRIAQLLTRICPNKPAFENEAEFDRLVGEMLNEGGEIAHLAGTILLLRRGAGRMDFNTIYPELVATAKREGKYKKGVMFLLLLVILSNNDNSPDHNFKLRGIPNDTKLEEISTIAADSRFVGLHWQNWIADAEQWLVNRKPHARN